jgi:hypothetical protein
MPMYRKYTCFLFIYSYNLYSFFPFIRGVVDIPYEGAWFYRQDALPGFSVHSDHKITGLLVLISLLLQSVQPVARLLFSRQQIQNTRLYQSAESGGKMKMARIEGRGLIWTGHKFNIIFLPRHIYCGTIWSRKMSQVHVKLGSCEQEMDYKYK